MTTPAEAPRDLKAVVFDALSVVAPCPDGGGRACLNCQSDAVALAVVVHLLSVNEGWEVIETIVEPGPTHGFTGTQQLPFPDP